MTRHVNSGDGKPVKSRVPVVDVREWLFSQGVVTSTLYGEHTGRPYTRRGVRGPLYDHEMRTAYTIDLTKDGKAE